MSIPPPPQLPDGGDYYDSTASATPVSGAGAHFSVDRESVLRVRAAIHDAAIELRRTAQSLREGLRMEPCGPDPVSIDVAAAVNRRVLDDPDSYYNTTLAHAGEGFRTAEALAETAHEFGYTEDEIAASLRPGAFDD